jgi:hypothetical protein
LYLRVFLRLSRFSRREGIAVVVCDAGLGALRGVDSSRVRVRASTSVVAVHRASPRLNGHNNDENAGRNVE